MRDSEHTRVRTSKSRPISHSIARRNWCLPVIYDLEIAEVSLVPRIVERIEVLKGQ